MDSQKKQDLITYLREFSTESRWERIQEIVHKRTRHLTVVVEDIYQPHNASAVLRSCDGFGIQDVHIIENKNEFEASSQVTIGADQWLTIHRYNQPNVDNTELCFNRLKDQGYKIIATTPHKNDTSLNDLDISGKTALVFGSEIDGISDRAMELADGFMKIPMYGFSESFNISVSAAVCLYNLTRRLRSSEIPWTLNNEEMQDLKLKWLRQSIRAGEELEKAFLET
ncbi:RNA methyltransferase [Rhodohalobacter sp.]|uniref:TrmH family RNA methyltransferase n=1 Tax=Rhodohalobacter sp. TaxID=1974210 RepID=UPI002ACD76F7|nr:RNA methyltransferase [Rhodohalobacter sp.]MDZ7756037.1 RNA methyltransferase [Rhodohalobacter sp.]